MTEEENYSKPLYKKWFRTSTNSGFLSITPWINKEENIKKFIIDIGEADVKTGSLKSSSNAFVDIYQFGAFLYSVANGSAALNYPKGFGKHLSDNPTDESISFYGGSGNVSRLFRIHHWQSSGSGEYTKFDSKSFVFKIGHFKAKAGYNGAIIPDMAQGSISKNMIKVSRSDINTMSYMIQAVAYQLELP